MPQDRDYSGWARILKAAGVPHMGTHAIRHRATTGIANSGVPLKVGMQPTAHKTVSQFMRYVHVEDKAVREAADLVSARRSQLTGSASCEPEARGSPDWSGPGGRRRAMVVRIPGPVAWPEAGLARDPFDGRKWVRRDDR